MDSVSAVRFAKRNFVPVKEMGAAAKRLQIVFVVVAVTVAGEAVGYRVVAIAVQGLLGVVVR